MLHIHDSCKEHFDKVIEFAKITNQLEQLQGRLDFLANYSCQEDPERTQCELMSDFAPYSFYFIMKVKSKESDYTNWFNGGLIYHGPHDRGGDGGAPTFSCNLSPVNGWSIHT